MIEIWNSRLEKEDKVSTKHGKTTNKSNPVVLPAKGRGGERIEGKQVSRHQNLGTNHEFGGYVSPVRAELLPEFDKDLNNEQNTLVLRNGGVQNRQGGVSQYLGFNDT